MYGINTRIRWFLLLVLVLAFGVTGYIIIEGYSFFDTLYMTVITIATIGYHEVRPLSDTGRAFNIVFIITGCFAF
jgi:voltage-gated potassium channel